LRALDRLIAGEKHIRLLGASSPIDQTCRSRIFGLLGGTRGPFSGNGDHGDVGVVGCWPLAIGPSALSLARILHNSRNSINVHTQHIFSSLKYLDWS
jgi:hypothetical protein